MARKPTKPTVYLLRELHVTTPEGDFEEQPPVLTDEDVAELYRVPPGRACFNCGALGLIRFPAVRLPARDAEPLLWLVSVDRRRDHGRPICGACFDALSTGDPWSAFQGITHRFPGDGNE